MPEWRTLKLNRKYIGMRTEKSTLIKMPANSDYPGYITWLSNKLVRESGSRYEVAIRPGFEITLILSEKNSSGNYVEVNRVSVSGDTFIRQFLNADEL